MIELKYPECFLNIKLHYLINLLINLWSGNYDLLYRWEFEILKQNIKFSNLETFLAIFVIWNPLNPNKK